jgi:hypothetical protein
MRARPRPRLVAPVWIAAVVALAAGGAGAACKSRRPALVQVVADEPDRFPHPLHAAKGLGCADCHGATGDARPGAADHAPCDRGECHAPAFAQQPGALCRVCHSAVTPDGDAELRAYPLEGGMRAKPARFAHDLHLDAARIERAVGFHVACVDCHSPREDADTPAAPGHVECSRCHAVEVALPRAPAMTACDGCHVEGDAATPRHPRRLITGDLHFDHRNHSADAKGRAIPCRSCHAGAVTARGRADHAPPSVRDCVTCHDDSDRVPTQMRMSSCETCHAEKTSGPTKLAPRDHLPLTERPFDHTIAFRTDHAEAARNAAARCATCHTQLSGSTVDTCDECHQVMRPSDHVVTFRELDHGSMAIADSGRCATCHVVDYCSDCHRQRPRSHLGGERFDLLEHGDLARLNLRSCMTCHDPRTDCARSGCHTIMGSQ